MEADFDVIQALIDSQQEVAQWELSTAREAVVRKRQAEIEDVMDLEEARAKPISSWTASRSGEGREGRSSSKPQQIKANRFTGGLTTFQHGATVISGQTENPLSSQMKNM